MSVALCRRGRRCGVVFDGRLTHSQAGDLIKLSHVIHVPKNMWESALVKHADRYASSLQDIAIAAVTGKNSNTQSIGKNSAGNFAQRARVLGLLIMVVEGEKIVVKSAKSLR